MIVKTCASNYSMKCKGRSANPFFAEWSIPIEIRGTSETGGQDNDTTKQEKRGG